jgi:alcohol dehydrogenase
MKLWCAQGWGLTVVLGIHATPKMMPLHPMELFDGRRITGCVFGDFKGKSQLPALVDKCINGVPLSLHLSQLLL